MLYCTVMEYDYSCIACKFKLLLKLTCFSTQFLALRRHHANNGEIIFKTSTRQRIFGFAFCILFFITGFIETVMVINNQFTYKIIIYLMEILNMYFGIALMFTMNLCWKKRYCEFKEMIQLTEIVKRMSRTVYFQKLDVVVIWSNVIIVSTVLVNVLSIGLMMLGHVGIYEIVKIINFHMAIFMYISLCYYTIENRIYYVIFLSLFDHLKTLITDRCQNSSQWEDVKFQSHLVYIKILYLRTVDNFLRSTHIRKNSLASHLILDAFAATWITGMIIIIFPNIEFTNLEYILVVRHIFTVIFNGIILNVFTELMNVVSIYTSSQIIHIFINKNHKE